MIKFYFPTSVDGFSGYFTPEQCRHSLFMAASESDRLLGVVRFTYQAPELVIEDILWLEKETDLQAFDGLMRSLLFHGVEMDCSVCTVRNPGAFKPYLENHGFVREGNQMVSRHFAERFFGQGCCGGDDRA